MKARQKIGIVIPVANESQTIERFCRALLKQIIKLKIDGQLYFVLDTISQDDTQKKLNKLAKRNKRISVIFEPKNRSVVDAYIRGYREALKDKCDWFIEMDCGFSHLPHELDKFIKGLEQGYDCVFGTRPLWSLEYPVPLKRRVFSLGGTILSNTLLQTHFSDMTSGYEAFTRKALKSILSKPIESRGNFWHVEMRYRSRHMRWKEVSIHYEFPSVNIRSQSLKDAFATLWSMTKQKWLG